MLCIVTTPLAVAVRCYYAIQAIRDRVVCAGSDLVAASAAALAAASVAFETQDATYSAQLLATAESLYT